MAGYSESTPFLADQHDDGHNGEESHVRRSPAANSYFKRPIKLLTSIIALLSLSILGLLIASFVLIQSGPFQFTYFSEESVRDLGICLFVSFIVSAPTILLPIPILINIAVHIAMSVVILVFSGKMLSHGWPDELFCRRWQRIPPYDRLPETPECIEAMKPIQLMMGISAGTGIAIGLLILTVLLLRLVALSKTRFWERKNFSLPFWNPTGFTIQLTLTVMPREPREPGDKKKPVLVGASASGQGYSLIEA